LSTAARFILLALVALWESTVPTQAANGQRRVALVIGNSAYVNTPRLENPKNDAADLAATLQQLGFEVIQGHDLDKAHMDRTIRSFAENIAGAQMALFFYAGHGLQVSGQNYLVPVDAKLSTASALDFEMIRLDLIQRTMERESATNIIMLDACRDNPLARNLARSLGTRSSSIGRGLAAVESGEGTLISFSTQPGNVALDGTGRNSPYAGALLKRMIVAGEDLPSILINVRNDVIAETNRRQVPWEHSALTAKVYFSPPQAEQAKGREVEHDQQVELTFWSSVKDSASPTVLRTYLDRYPDGEFATVARALIERYEQALKADLAARDEEIKRREQLVKEAELKRLEEERRAKETALAEERLRAEQAKNALEAKRIEEQERSQHAASAEELRKALDEVRIAREAAKAAEEQRLAAVKAADEATKAASQTIARKREAAEAESGKNKDAEAKVAALPKEESETSRFDGIWTFTRSSSPKCPEKYSVFRVRIEGGIVTGPTGNKGTLSPAGKITLSGKFNDFTGTLRGNTGSGTFTGICTGTFTAARN
jgi:uncharacterized caspase-like protein